MKAVHPITYLLMNMFLAGDIGYLLASGKIGDTRIFVLAMALTYITVFKFTATHQLGPYADPKKDLRKKKDDDTTEKETD